MSERREGHCPPGGVMDGSQWSGVGTVVPPLEGVVNAVGARKQILRTNRAQTDILGGMASVHVTTSNASLVPAGATNQMLVCDVMWQSGRATGKVERVSITRGAVFTIGAADVIELVAYIVSTDGLGFVPGPSKRVEVAVCWGTSISPKPCYIASQQISLAAGVDSAPLTIPDQAESLITASNTPANLPTLSARFTTFGGGRVYTTQNPFANGSPIVGGAEQVIFNSTVGGDAIVPIWELYL